MGSRVGWVWGSGVGWSGSGFGCGLGLGLARQYGRPLSADQTAAEAPAQPCTLPPAPCPLPPAPCALHLAHGGGVVGPAQLEVGLLLLAVGRAPPAEVVIGTWSGVRSELGLGLESSHRHMVGGAVRVS